MVLTRSRTNSETARAGQQQTESTSAEDPQRDGALPSTSDGFVVDMRAPTPPLAGRPPSAGSAGTDPLFTNPADPLFTNPAAPLFTGPAAQLSAGYAATLSAGHAAPLSAGYAAPLSAGHTVALSAGYAATLSAGHAAPLSAGYAAPLSAGHTAPLSSGYVAPLSAGQAAPLTTSAAPLTMSAAGAAPVFTGVAAPAPQPVVMTDQQLVLLLQSIRSLPPNQGAPPPPTSSASKPGDVKQAVKDAIDTGYRHIDCAYLYGNEKEVGEAITAKIKEGVVKREDLFITSKLWNTFHRPELVRPSLDETLKNLNVSYVDLYLIHWPEAYKEGGSLFPTGEDGKIQFSDADYVDTWKAMEPLVAAGLVRSLGVSNFNSKQVARVLEVAKIKPVTNQVECHPYLNQRRLKDFCEARGIKITAYSPLGSPERPWAKPGDPQLMEDPKLKAIAKRLNKTVAQVLIRYQIDRGVIVIPKSATKSRIESNFNVFDFKLSAEDMSLIDSFDCNGRLWVMDVSFGHKDHPFENDEF